MLRFLVPILQFAMQTGPMSFVAWAGRTAADNAAAPTDDAMWSNFQSSDWHMLFMCLRIVESLFMWLDTLMVGFFAVAFAVFATSLADRYECDDKMKKLAFGCAGLFTLSFLCGVMREVS